MKYMTFNSSCAFAGVANMLSLLGTDVEDRDIALGMELPYLFDKTDEAYIGGTMLQSARWFNLYLNTLGYSMSEQTIAKHDVPNRLRNEKTAMLGIHLSPRDKHAVVYTNISENRFIFTNNKWQHTDDPEILELTEQELMERLDEQVVIAAIQAAPITNADFFPLFSRSCQVLTNLNGEIQDFCIMEKSADDIGSSMNTLFRPVLLDGITMLDLIGQENVAGRLRTVQTEFLSAVRAKKAMCLSDAMRLDLLTKAIDAYIGLIQNKLAGIE